MFYTEIMRSDLPLSEIKILLYMITKGMTQQGERIEKNMKEIMAATELSKSGVSKAISSLKEKNIIYEGPRALEFLALKKLKEPLECTHRGLFYAQDLFAQLKGKSLHTWPENDHKVRILHAVLDVATVSRNKGCQWLLLEPSYLIIYTHTEARARASSDDSAHGSPRSFTQQIPYTEQSEIRAKEPPHLTRADIDRDLETKTIELGAWTYAVVTTFIDMGHRMTYADINGIKEWLLKAAEVYKVEDEDDLEWAKMVLFEWENYYRDLKNSVKLTTLSDYIHTYQKFLSNSKKR